jgi:hypothetical protein
MYYLWYCVQIFLSSQISKSALGATQPPIQFELVVRQLSRKHEVKNDQNFSLRLPYAFLACKGTTVPFTPLEIY